MVNDEGVICSTSFLYCTSDFIFLISNYVFLNQKSKTFGGIVLSATHSPLTTHHSMPAKTRIAPTPSGYLHTGNALNFLLTAALAKRAGAAVLLRIDDLDRERYRTAYAGDIFETLRFLGIQPDEGPRDVDDFEKRWSQRWRMNLYNEALEKLRRNNSVFACTCTRTQSDECDCKDKALSFDAPNTSWRLITNGEPIAMRSLDGSFTTAPLPIEMKNFIVRKKDGFPSYQLSSVVDDLHFGIDFIVRGEDLWASTLAQLVLAKQLGEDKASISFYHHPLLTSKGEKLSKSAGASSIKHWRNRGRTLAEFFEYLGELLHTSSPIKNARDLLKVFSL